MNYGNRDDSQSLEVRVSDTKFCLVINQTKIGTQFIKRFNTHEGKKDVDETRVNIVLGKDNTWSIECAQVENKNSLKDIQSLDNFLNQTTTKETIVLIRNPFKRFLSAFNQDYIRPFFEIYSTEWDYFNILGTTIFKQHDAKTYNSWMGNRNRIQTIYHSHIDNNSEIETELEVEDELLLSTILETMLVNWAECGINVDSKHNIFYHTAVLNMLFKTKNKFKIVDIDDTNLNNVFGKYCVGNSNFGKPNESNFTKDLLLKIIHKNSKLRSYIDHELKTETLSYNTLLNYSK